MSSPTIFIITAKDCGACNQIKSGGDKSVYASVISFLKSRGCLIDLVELESMKSRLKQNDPINVFLNKYFIGPWFPMLICVHPGLLTAIKNQSFKMDTVSVEEAASLVNIFNGEWVSSKGKLDVNRVYPRMTNEAFGSWLESCFSSPNYAKASRWGKIPIAKSAFVPPQIEGVITTPVPSPSPPKATPVVEEPKLVCKNYRMTLHCRYG
jgi:hypothetical protein